MVHRMWVEAPRADGGGVEEGTRRRWAGGRGGSEGSVKKAGRGSSWPHLSFAPVRATERRWHTQGKIIMSEG